MTLPRYPAYKDSGVEWLGEVPVHWEIANLKYVADFINGDAFKPSDWREHGIQIIRIQNLNGGENFNCVEGPVEDRYLVTEGELLFGWSGNRGTSFGPFMWQRPGKYALNQHIFRVLPNSLDKAELYWTLKAVTEHVEEQAHGIIGMVHITKTDLGAIKVPIPARSEQAAIATFLDHETSKIDALIAEQKNLIALLKEKRQAVISHVVTKGLNPDVPMKDSGVEWLGEVPEHWRVMGLSRVTESRCDGPFGTAIKSEHYTDEGARVIRLQNIRSGSFDDADSAYLDLDYFRSSLSTHEVLPNDILVAGLGDERNDVGRACVAPSWLGPALVKADCFRFRLNDGSCVPQFVAFQLSAGAASDSGRFSTGTTRQRMPLSVTGKRKIALPPKQEQQAIFNVLETKIAGVETLVSEAELSIRFLNERRVALISAAVTGKIDVRNLVAQEAA